MADQQIVRAYARGLTQTPRKLSLVASLVRGRTVDDALVILNHTPKRAALPLAKAIESARANAVNTHGLDAGSLTITTLSVTAGIRQKRYRPASRGRALPFQKRSANVLIEVKGTEKPKPKPAAKQPAASKKEKQ